jgi:hypothetical protein
MAVDLCIVDARIVDGTTRPWFRASVAIDGDEIEGIYRDASELPAATRRIDADGDVVGTVMQDEQLRQQGEAAADFAKDLAGAGHVDEHLSPERERETLARATWLVEQEFDAEVVVFDTDNAPEDLTSNAEPGRPAINIEE